MEPRYFVYIMTNRHRTVLYTGVTGDLVRRVFEHRSHAFPGFTNRYNGDRLVFYEELVDPTTAIAREKQLKAGPRRKKITLIEAINPEWRDLYEDLL